MEESLKLDDAKVRLLTAFGGEGERAKGRGPRRNAAAFRAGVALAGIGLVALYLARRRERLLRLLPLVPIAEAFVDELLPGRLTGYGGPSHRDEEGHAEGARE